jgi:oligopeptide transport system substrate-binding protein
MSQKILTFFFLITLILLKACQQQETPSEVIIESEQNKSVDHLRLPLNGAVKTLDPGLILKINQIELVEQLFLGLTDFDPKTYEVLPELAKEWQISEGGTVYTFRLRQDVKWTNGEPVKAQDIVWAIRRNISPFTDSPYAHTLYIIKNAEQIYLGEISDITELGVLALDDYTVEFTLKQPASYFPALVSLWTYRPLPRKAIEQYGAEWIEPKYILTNGPYLLSEWEKGQHLILNKNPDYYDAEKVSIPKVDYMIVNENSLALAMYEKNELDIIGGQVYRKLPEREMSRIKSDPRLRKERYITPSFCTEWYGFNTKRAPMDNPFVRKAIAAAIDKKTLLNVIIKGEDVPATTFIPPPIFGAIEASEDMGILFRPKQARAWLTKAGYPDGKGFPEVVLMYNNSKTHHEVAKAIKTILKHHLNIDIVIQGYEFIPYISLLNQENKPHLFRMSWCPDYPDAHVGLYEVFHPTEGINWIGWNNLEFVQEVERAMKISNPKKRKKHYFRAEQILTEEEAVIIPLYFSMTQYLVKPWVKEWSPIGFGGQQILFWRLE